MRATVIYRKFLIQVMVVLGTLLLITQVIKPTFEKIVATQNRIKEVNAKLSILQEKEVFLEGLQARTLQIQAKKLSGAIPNTIDLPLILATIEKLAGITGVELGDFSISSQAAAVTLLPIENAQNLSIFRFEVALSGSLENTKRFYTALGGISPLLSIEAIDFGKDKATVTFNFHFQPKSTSQPSLGTTLVALDSAQKTTIDKAMTLAPPVLEEESTNSIPQQPLRGDPFTR